MSQREDKKIVGGAPENAEKNTAKPAENARPAAAAGTRPSMDENESRSEKRRIEARQAARVKRERAKRRRRRQGITVQVAAVLLIVTLLFGAVVGYALGRVNGSQRLKTAEARVAELTLAVEEASSNGDWDYYTGSLTEENQSALGDLSGASLTTADGDISALAGEADGAAATEAAPVVVAEYSGGTVMSDEVQRAYSEQLAESIFNGASEADVSDTLVTDVMTSIVSEHVLEAKAQELGVYDLTDEDRAAVDAEAKQNYEDLIAFYLDFVRTEGMSDADARTAAENYLAEDSGVTLESLTQDLLKNRWSQKLYDLVTKDVTLTDAEIKAAYDAKLADQQSQYDSYPDEYEYAQLNGETIVYNPAGYRAVKLIELNFPADGTADQIVALNDEIATLDSTADAAQIAEYRQTIDGYYAELETKAQAVLDALNAGTGFDALIDQYGEDVGMKDAAIRARGYSVSETSLAWPADAAAACMALASPGDVTGIQRLENGVGIFQYIGEVTPGAVAFDDVKDAIAVDALEEKKAATYEEQTQAWLAEANPVYYPERLQ